MSPAFYKVVHLSGIFMLLAAYGAAVALSLQGATAKGTPGRTLVVATHGTGMFFALLGGFGLVAREGVAWPWPGWLFAKIVIWLALGGLLTLALRKPAAAKPLWFGVLALAILAACLAQFKPF